MMGEDAREAQMGGGFHEEPPREKVKIVLFGLWMLALAAFFVGGWLWAMGAEYGAIGVLGVLAVIGYAWWRQHDRERADYERWTYEQMTREDD